LPEPGLPLTNTKSGRDGVGASDTGASLADPKGLKAETQPTRTDRSRLSASPAVLRAGGRLSPHRPEVGGMLRAEHVGGPGSCRARCGAPTDRDADDPSILSNSGEGLTAAGGGALRSGQDREGQRGRRTPPGPRGHAPQRHPPMNASVRSLPGTARDRA
jgi:hypothetical protein